HPPHPHPPPPRHVLLLLLQTLDAGEQLAAELGPLDIALGGGVLGILAREEPAPQVLVLAQQLLGEVRALAEQRQELLGLTLEILLVVAHPDPSPCVEPDRKGA